MACITSRFVRRSVVGLLAPLCLMLVSHIVGGGNPAYATSIITLQIIDSIVAPPGSGIPSDVFTVHLPDTPAASFIGSLQVATEPDPPGSAQEFASADLTTGELKAFATVTGPYGATAFAGFTDMVSFRWEDAAKLDPILVTATFTLNSSFSGSSNLTFPDGNFSYLLGPISEFHSFTCGALCPLSLTDTQSFLATPFASLPFQMGILVSAGSLDPNGSATFDAGHTAGLSFVLPDGAILQSSSGFLLNPLAAVPEPPTNLLTGIALVGLARLARYRRTDQNA